MPDRPTEIPALEELEPLSEMLVRARWVAAACGAPVVFLMWAVAALYLNVWGMAGVLGLLVLINLVTLAHARRRLGRDVNPRVRALRLDAAVRLGLAADVVAVGLAFNFLGGIESPLPFLAAFHVAAVAVWLGRREAYKLVLGLVTAVGIVAMLEFNRALYHWHLMNDWRWYSEREPCYVVSYLAVLFAVLFLVAWTAGARRRSF